MADKLYGMYWYNVDTANLFSFDFQTKNTSTFWPAPASPWDCGLCHIVAADALGTGYAQACLLHSENGGAYNGKANIYVFDFITKAMTPFGAVPQSLPVMWSFVAGDLLGAGYDQFCTSSVDPNAQGTFEPINLYIIDFKTKVITQFWPGAQAGWNLLNMTVADVLGLGYAQICLFHDYGNGMVNLFALDCKTKAMTALWPAPQSGLDLGTSKIVSGDFLDLGYSQVCLFHDYNGGLTNFLALDFKTRNTTAFYQAPQVGWGGLSSVRMVGADVLGKGYSQVCVFHDYGRGQMNFFALDFKTRDITPFYGTPEPWNNNQLLVNDENIVPFPKIAPVQAGGTHPFPQLYCVTAFDDEGDSNGSFTFRAVSAADAQAQAERKGWGGPGANYQVAQGSC